MTRAVGQGRVALAVDDDPLVLMMTAEMLRDLGFEVLEAETGAAALQLLRERPEVALLLTDIRMPGMDGVELAKRATGSNPVLKVVFASGHTGAHRRLPAPLLMKPYDTGDLVRVVEGRLQG